MSADDQSAVVATVPPQPREQQQQPPPPPRPAKPLHPLDPKTNVLLGMMISTGLALDDRIAGPPTNRDPGLMLQTEAVVKAYRQCASTPFTPRQREILEKGMKSLRESYLHCCAYLGLVRNSALFECDPAAVLARVAAVNMRIRALKTPRDMDEIDDELIGLRVDVLAQAPYWTPEQTALVTSHTSRVTRRFGHATQAHGRVCRTNGALYSIFDRPLPAAAGPSAPAAPAAPAAAEGDAEGSELGAQGEDPEQQEVIKEATV
jgi:hypothetical protein